MADAYDLFQHQLHGGDDSNDDRKQGGDGSSSDDDDDVQLGRKRLPRHRYKTVDASSDSDDGDMNSRRRQQQSRKEERIYGIFGESDDHENTNFKSSRQYKTSQSAVAPTFVKGQSESQDAAKNCFDSKKNDEVAQDEGRNLDQNQLDIDLVEDKDEIYWKRKQEEANQHFLNLVNIGRTEGKVKVARSFTPTDPDLSERNYGVRENEDNTGRNVAPNLSGLGYNREATEESDMQIENSTSTMHDAGPALSSTPGLGMLPSQFGMKTQSSSSFKKDPNLGKWEKHTKGIGMKLLSKMGYKGSGGIGKRKELQETVIDRPIEVKIRPANVGLGFGNFREANKPKTNKATADNTAELPMHGSSTTVPQSVLPSNADLLKEKSWRKGAKIINQRNRKRNILEYTELLRQGQTNQPSIKIIDMRGPITSSSVVVDGEANESNTKEIPLGEELLHNLSIILNTYETKIFSTNQFAGSAQRKVTSLLSDLDDIQRRRQQFDDRRKKLHLVQESLDSIDVLLSEEIPRSNNSSNSVLASVMKKIEELGKSFSDEERQVLQFSSVIIPSLLEPVIKARVDEWHPLEDSLSVSKGVIRLVLLLTCDMNSGNVSPLADDTTDLLQLQLRLLVDYLLPRISLALQSSRWNPIHDTEVALNLFESLQEIVENEIESTRDTIPDEIDGGSQSVLPSSFPLETEGKKNREFSNLIQSAIVHKVVYKRLLTSIGRWEPRLIQKEVNADAGRSELEDRLDLWVLPWIPYLADDRELTAHLVSDCKRKIKISLSFLQKTFSMTSGNQGTSSGEAAYCSLCITVLRPWRSVFKRESIQSMVSEYVTNRLARFVSSRVSKSPIFDRNGNDAFRWADFELLFQIHSQGLLSDLEFLSVLEGEIMTSWALAIHQWFSSRRDRDDAVSMIAANYKEWKIHILQPSLSKDDNSIINQSYDHTALLLQRDKRICACFYAALLMIQAAQSGDQELLARLRPPRNNNYRVVLASRKFDAKQLAEDDLVRMNATGVVKGDDTGEIAARIRLNRSELGSMPTFRDVVSEFARERGILFQPRLSNGTNASKDGKQIFKFGSIPVYLDGTVAFALLQGHWKAVSLESLAESAEESGSNKF